MFIKKRPRVIVTLVPAAVVVALVVAACGGSGSGATTLATPSSSSPAPTAAGQPSPAAVLSPTPPPPGPATSVDAAGLTPVVALAQDGDDEVDALPSVPEIVKRLTPSVVHIQTEAVRLDIFNRPVPVGGVGTGEIIDSRGLILTNNHVVEGAERIIVTLQDGRALEAEIVGRDPSTDLAVIRIEADNLTAIPLGSSAALEIGETVIAIGHALNLPGGPTVTGGLVSALDRVIDVSPTITIRHLIQTDAAINPGNSGGPLVNRRGQMVGINTAKIEAGESIGFAIALDPVRPIIEELISRGRVERGFLGASGVTITRALAMSRSLPVDNGVGIVTVAPGSPAERAGLKPGDIIVGLAGKEVRNAGDLDSILVRYRTGASVTVEVLRGEQRLTLEAVLGDQPRDG
ncbi:MAG: trypsin-like peptidase domain-containing protein [Dehalococcoidia bacterium]